MGHLRYRVGIDVGSNSVGFAAVEVDDLGHPLRLLNNVVHIHDGGIDPTGRKARVTRLAVSGVARRTRRLTARRRQRLKQLDEWILAQGWPIQEIADIKDPYGPWRIRARLASEYVADEAERHAQVAIAVRHMARHRGWRNPYVSIASLRQETADSDYFKEVIRRAREAGAEFPDENTPAQVVCAVGLTPAVKVRGENSVLDGRLHQSDHMRELKRICAMQRLSDELFHELGEQVFRSASPKGSAAQRAGHDVLPGQEHLPRAPRSSEAFQRFRLASILANLRLRVRGEKSDRPLTVEERAAAFDVLWQWGDAVPPSWADVAQVLGVERSSLRGTATPTSDGELSAARPPINTTDRVMRGAKSKSLKAWWTAADPALREAMVDALSNNASLDESTPEGAAVIEFLAVMDEDERASLDNLSLPSGRAAYSVDSLERMSRRLLSSEDDLFAVRQAEFGVPNDWHPPVPAVGERVGNPAVDRVLKLVARWLTMVTSQWGEPLSVNIEHVRDGFVSEATAAEMTRSMDRRAKVNDKISESILETAGIKRGEVRASDRARYLAVTRQNSECLYCGSPITFKSCEMDHIVPRKGVGSTNRRENLAAVCKRCNSSKSNTPFRVWAESCGLKGVSVKEAVDRVQLWLMDPGVQKAAHRAFVKDVKFRLQRVEGDPEIDGRSMESVAWMATELARRIRHQYLGRPVADGEAVEPVKVFRGSLTAEARKASGIERQVVYIGGAGKKRLDRRHHAVDATVIAMMRPSVAKTLAERTALRDEQRLTGQEETWKSYRGTGVDQRELYDRWWDDMQRIVDLLNRSLTEDLIGVVVPLRLRLGSSKAHDDTVRKLQRKPLSSAFSVEEIDRASTPALWCALTRESDFDPVEGLPAKEDRQISVRGALVRADQTVGIFSSSAAGIALREGWAEVGDTVHHARIYRYVDGKRARYGMVRVFAADLLRHRTEDLFNAPLLPQSISMRYADPRVRAAIDGARAEYLGWLVTGDEIVVSDQAMSSGAVRDVKEVLGVRRWRVDGFPSDSKLRLRPSQIASEGLKDADLVELAPIIDRPGWRPEVNVVLKSGAKVIRRDVLGRPRENLDSGLPTGWQVAPV